MSLIELLIIAVGLSMDAFAVSICKGLSLQKMDYKKALIAGLYFGFFQGLMPLIGYFVGSQFAHLVDRFDHWIVFILLALIGGKMIYEAFHGEGEPNPSFKFKEMFPLAIATSIDALAVGVSFAFLKVEILGAVTIIGVTTLIISMIGVKIGNLFGAKYQSKAEIAGGIVLILIGLKVLLSHLL